MLLVAPARTHGLEVIEQLAHVDGLGHVAFRVGTVVVHGPLSNAKDLPLSDDAPPRAAQSFMSQG